MRRIGPSPWMGGVMAVTSPLFWIGIALSVVAILPVFVDIGKLPEVAVNVLGLMTQYHVGMIGGLIAAIGGTAGVTCGVTTEYLLSEDAIVVTHGYFSPFSRAGRFHRDVNTVTLRFVTDADYTQSLVQLVTGVGCVRLQMATGEIVMLPYVEHPMEIRGIIMAKSGVKDTRLFAKTEQCIPQ